MIEWTFDQTAEKYKMTVNKVSYLFLHVLITCQIQERQ